MPIGTFMVPVHPLLVPLVLIAGIFWAATAFVLPGADLSIAGLGLAEDLGKEPRWTIFLIPIILLSIGLSIPVLSWAVLAMGGRLIQAALIILMLGAMIGDAFTGRADEKWLVIPLAYTVFYLYQFIGGPIRARYIQKRNSAYVAMQLGELWLNSHHQIFAEGDPMQCGTAARVFSPSAKGENRKQYRLSPDDGAHLKEVSNGLLPKRWWLTQREGFWILSVPANDSEEHLTITRKPYRDPLGIVRGNLFETSVYDGCTKRSIVTGQVLVTRLPLLSLFYWISILGGKSQSVVGFDARKFGELSYGERTEKLALRQLLDISEGPQFETAALDQLEQEIRDVQPSFKSARQRFWHAMEAGDRYLNHKADYDFLSEKAEQCEKSDLLHALSWLRRGREAGLLSEVQAATSFIEKMPHRIWKECREEMLEGYNSRILAITWPMNMVLPNGDPPYPEDTPVFGRMATQRAGFGLMRDFPYFYMGLFQLSPELEQIVTKMILEARIISMPLASALDNLVPKIERGNSG